MLQTFLRYEAKIREEREIHSCPGSDHTLTWGQRCLLRLYGHSHLSSLKSAFTRFAFLSCYWSFHILFLFVCLFFGFTSSINSNNSPISRAVRCVEKCSLSPFPFSNVLSGLFMMLIFTFGRKEHSSASHPSGLPASILFVRVDIPNENLVSWG